MRMETAFGKWEINETDDGHLEVSVVGAGRPLITPSEHRNSVVLMLPLNRKQQRETAQDRRHQRWLERKG